MKVEIIKAEPEEVRLGSQCSGNCFLYHGDLYLTTNQVRDNHVGCVELESGVIFRLVLDTMIIPVQARAVASYRAD